MTVQTERQGYNFVPQSQRTKAGRNQSTIAAKGEQVIKTDENVRIHRKGWHKQEAMRNEVENMQKKINLFSIRAAHHS